MPHKVWKHVDGDPLDPWSGVLPTALAAELDHGLVESENRSAEGSLFAPAGDPTIRAALTAVMDAGAAEAEYGDDPWWHHFTPVQVLDSLRGLEARDVVRCWVSDSMASGTWSLNEVHLGRRGYVFYVPDFGIGDREDLPVLGGWEPVDNQALRRACLLGIYREEWQNLGYPPFFGQWARGDVEILLGGMEGALQEHPEAWERVGEWIDTYLGSRITLEDEDIPRVAQMVAQSPARVRKVAGALGGNAAGWVGTSARREDAEVVIGLVVHCLGKGPY